MEGSLDAPFASRWRLLVGMSVVALTLAAVVLGIVLPRLDAPPPASDAPPILDFPAARVNVIDVERGRKNFRLKAGEAGWSIQEHGRTEPVPDGRVEEFLEALLSLPPLLEIGAAGQVPLADFGLSPPRDLVTLHRRGGGDSIQVRIGDRNPPLTGVYVEIMPGGQVVMVGAVLLLEVDKLAALASRDAFE